MMAQTRQKLLWSDAERVGSLVSGLFSFSKMGGFRSHLSCCFAKLSGFGHRTVTLITIDLLSQALRATPRILNPLRLRPKETKP
jgi:hypothetical protein